MVQLVHTTCVGSEDYIITVRVLNMLTSTRAQIGIVSADEHREVGLITIAYHCVINGDGATVTVTVETATPTAAGDRNRCVTGVRLGALVVSDDESCRVVLRGRICV